MQLVPLWQLHPKFLEIPHRNEQEEMISFTGHNQRPRKKVKIERIMLKEWKKVFCENSNKGFNIQKEGKSCFLDSYYVFLIVVCSAQSRLRLFESLGL